MIAETFDLPVADFAGELPAVGVARDGDVGNAKRFLRGIGNFTREEELLPRRFRGLRRPCAANS